LEIKALDYKVFPKVVVIQAFGCDASIFSVGSPRGIAFLVLDRCVYVGDVWDRSLRCDEL
jgi:hypothetical protein